MIDQFERKRCQKKREYVSYQLLWVFFLKHFIVHEWSAVKRLFNTSVWSKVDVFYCDRLYFFSAGNDLVRIKSITRDYFIKNLA